ncbi:GNAT family N-acetyltransferase [Streptomyces sp. B6B3]|uniref:GNAT family N-acetyltransferase n=1 Tax=Streptomyces sp. B6B3 TaxID=3153570 RepID=UPI00325D3658
MTTSDAARAATRTAADAPARTAAGTAARTDSLGTAPRRPEAWAATCRVRRLTVADLPDCLDLAADRGWSREEGRWRLLLSAGQGFGVDAPPGDAAGGLIASVVATRYPGLDGGPGLSCLGMMLVAQRYARRGLGLRLMRHVIAAERDGGAAAMFLTATEQGRPLYERLGFVPLGSLGTLRGHLAAGAAPTTPPGAATIRPATAADLPAVLAYDRSAFGADRTALLTRLPSFADQFLVAESAAPADSTESTGSAAARRLTGFAAAWPNVASTVIGPVVADDPDTALALVSRLATGAPAGTPVRFDADARQPEPAGWLRAHGLVPYGSPVTVMVDGLPALPGDAGRRFAPYSLALG